jgi:uridine phosphorylase
MSTVMKREIHMTGADLMGMVQLRPEDIGKYAIVPGPRERADAIVKKLENPVKNFTFMEYTMHTGEYAGTKVTTINGGRFSPDTAITTELLCHAKPECMIRIGSCGALREDIKIGDLIVIDSAIRGEGVTQYYVDGDFEPKTDPALTKLLTEVAQKTGSTVHSGKVWTTDAILRETREHVQSVIDKGAIAVDMVSSTFMTIAQLHKIPSAVIMAVSDNIVTGQMGFLDPGYYMAESTLVSIALDVIKKKEGK